MKFQRMFLLFLTVILAAFFTAACSDSSSEQKEEATTLESDKDLKSQLEAEEGIESAMVQVVEGDEKVVNVDIQLTPGQKITADEAIEKYSSAIKEKYPDEKVDLIIAQDGKQLKQTTLE